MALNVLLAGCGQMGRAHLSSLQLLQNERKVGSLVAVDTDSSRLASLGEGVQGYTSLETALMTENPELIVLATNTAVHSQNIKKILDYASRTGNYPSLFVEKPFVESSAEVEQLQPELERVGYASAIPLAFAYLIRFSPVVEDAISHLNQTDVPIKSAEILWFQRYDSRGELVETKEYSLDTPQSNRVYQELAAMLNYHQTKVRPQNLASLEDATRDVVVTEMLGKEDLVLPYSFKI